MSAMEPDHTIYAFGAFTLDVARGTLSRDGVESRLRPKTHAVLRYLVEHPGRLVGKQELLDAVWGSTVVTEGSLTQCVIEIRRALGDAGQRMVRTVPRQGFMLDAAVSVTSLPSQPSAADMVAEAKAGPAAAAPADHPAWRSGRVAAVVLGLLLLAGVVWWFITHRAADPATEAASAPPAAASARSIAVLRFLDLSPNGDQAYFADGLAEEILHLLAQSPNLKVIARSSSFAFEPGSVDLGAVAEQLDVAYVLEGSVRRAAEQLRITVQLIDTATHAHVWSRTYDRTPSGVLEVQGEVAADVASALAASLQLPPISNSTDGAAAQDLYLLGRHLFLRRGPGDLDAAERHFQRAVQLDPQHARAWTALAGVYNVRALDVLHDPKYRLEEQRVALERALAIDPTLGEAHLRLARYFRLKGDTAAAESAFERAKQLAPGDPLVIASLSGRAFRDGQLDSAIELATRVVELDPLSAIYRSTLGHILLAAGRFDAALAQLRRAEALSPDDLQTRTDVALALLLLGRDEEAREAIVDAPADPRADQLRVLVATTADADAAYARLQACDSAQCQVLLAEIAAHRGDADAAFERLAAARGIVITNASQADFEWATEIAVSPFLRPLHEDPRWGVLRIDRPAR
jgi:TolB-like protein/DNA-binding winged helix-turn-helix (wHTH) protein/Tfp pilus assembly protein PilF